MPDTVPPVVPAGRLRDTAQPRIAVDELVLRPWVSSDAAAVVAAYRDPEIQRWHLLAMTEDEAVHQVRRWADRWPTESGADWVVEADGRFLGRVGLRTVDLAEGHGEAAYWIIPAARGRGVAPRALAALAEYMFTQIGLHRLDLEHSTRNEASCRVAAKAGFLLEGTKRSSVLHADGWHDMHLHARVHER